MGVDANGAPYSLFKDVKVSGLTASKKSILKETMPYKADMPEDLKTDNFVIDLSFMGNYQEPEIELTVSMEELFEHGSIEYTMVFDPTTANWELVLMHNKEKDMIGVAEFKSKTSSQEQSIKPSKQVQKKPVHNSANV